MPHSLTARWTVEEDYLEGLKENVIIGRLIPAGTGALDDQSESGGHELDDAERGDNDADALLKENPGDDDDE